MVNEAGGAFGVVLVGGWLPSCGVPPRGAETVTLTVLLRTPSPVVVTRYDVVVAGLTVKVALPDVTAARERVTHPAVVLCWSWTTPFATSLPCAR